jgi:hypothetical protein
MMRWLLSCTQLTCLRTSPPKLWATKNSGFFPADVTRILVSIFTEKRRKGTLSANAQRLTVFWRRNLTSALLNADAKASRS